MAQAVRGTASLVPHVTLKHLPLVLGSGRRCAAHVETRPQLICCSTTD